jgi:nitroimidazol reductase NimA-like FMN-containing flavoprotein (pyridoxamine 5'-phosphate oxidase superfamily)
MNTPDDEGPVHVLHPEESWEFLDSHEFGRLAYHLADEVHIVPINYAVHDHSVYFSTTEGSKLLGVAMNCDVAFEADEVVGEHATSVVVRGRAKEVTTDTTWILEQLPLRPWIDTVKTVVIRLDVDEITGRRFDLHRPWLHARVDT